MILPDGELDEIKSKHLYGLSFQMFQKWSEHEELRSNIYCFLEA